VTAVRPNRSVAKGLFRGLVFLATLVAVAFLVRSLDLTGVLDTEWIDTRIRNRGLTGELLFLAAGILFTAAGLPRQVISFLGGYAFGFLLGTALALLATLGGCAATFHYARFLGRGFVAHRFPGRIRRADQFLRENPFSTTLLIRLIPVGSNVITNLVAGVSSVPAAPFLLGSILGFIPQTVVFALVGSGIAVAPEFRITLGAILFVVSGAIGIHLYRRSRTARAVVEDSDGDGSR
jgi:uncharacterized membrane protein YdjX (TVP38/TMEM64 family)